MLVGMLSTIDSSVVPIRTHNHLSAVPLSRVQRGLCRGRKCCMQNKCSMRLWKAIWMLAAVTSSDLVVSSLAADPSGVRVCHLQACAL